MIGLRTVRYTTIFLIWSFVSLSAFGTRNESTLESIEDVRALSAETSADALPVHFEAQVVRKSNKDKGFFLFDGEYGIYAKINESVALARKVQVGDLIKIKGTTISGTFSPSILIDRLEVVENRPLPESRYLLPFEFSSELIDCDWVKIRGRLIAFKEHKSYDSIHVTLQHDQTTINIRVPSAPGYIEGLQSKLFEWVELSAVAGVASNSERQFIQRVFFANSADDFMVMPREINQKEIETVPIHQLRHYGNDSRNVVRTYGRVTHVADYEVFVRGEKASLKSTYPESQYITIGQLIELEGIVMEGAVAPSFRARSIKVIGKKEIPIPREVDLGQTIPLNLDSELVKIQAELVQVSTPLIAPLRQDLVLICKTGERQFEARLKRGYDPGYSLEPGSIIEIVGISHVGSYEFVPWNINPTVWIQLRSRDDIHVVKTPPWLNTTRLTWIGVALAGIALSFLLWIIILRKVIEKQTGVIHEKVENEVILDERQRIARELHDNLAQGLTGAAVRLESSRWLLNHTNEELLVELENISAPQLAGKEGEILRVIDRGRVDMDRTNREFKVVQDMLTYCGEESRTSIMDLRGGPLEEMDLPKAMQQDLSRITDEVHAELSFNVTGVPLKLKRMAERNLLMVAREAVTNGVRRGKATNFFVTLEYLDDSLTLSIVDDGGGFNTDELPEGHFGICGMRERMNRLHGEINIESRMDEGTRVEITLLSLGEWKLEMV